MMAILLAATMSGLAEAFHVAMPVVAWSMKRGVVPCRRQLCGPVAWPASPSAYEVPGRGHAGARSLSMGRSLHTGDKVEVCCPHAQKV